VRSGVSWMRLGGCERVSFLVAVGDEAARAGRFWERLGRRPIATPERVRSRPGEGSAGAAGAQ
jgi:hypothetical protein